MPGPNKAPPPPSSRTTASPPANKILIRVPNARIAFAKALRCSFPNANTPPAFIPRRSSPSPAPGLTRPRTSDRIASSASASRSARNSVLQGGNFVGDDSKLGEDGESVPERHALSAHGDRRRASASMPARSSARTDSAMCSTAASHRKVPQIGNVIIGDDVELGANVAIDRGALGSTIIGRGTKIDNLVQIAHNVEIGEASHFRRAGGHCGQHQAGQLRRCWPGRSALPGI